MILTRFAYFKDRTIGRLEHEGFTAWTLERPHLANKKAESCIPEGEYRMERYDSPTFGDRTWQVLGAPGRTFIAIHAANYANQLAGCIALGTGLYRNMEGVENSRTAVDKFYEQTAGEDCLLIRIVRGEMWC